MLNQLILKRCYIIQIEAWNDAQQLSTLKTFTVPHDCYFLPFKTHCVKHETFVAKNIAYSQQYIFYYNA